MTKNDKILLASEALLGALASMENNGYIAHESNINTDEDRAIFNIDDYTSVLMRGVAGKVQFTLTVNKDKIGSGYLNNRIEYRGFDMCSGVRNELSNVKSINRTVTNENGATLRKSLTKWLNEVESTRLAVADYYKRMTAIVDKQYTEHAERLNAIEVSPPVDCIENEKTYNDVCSGLKHYQVGNYSATRKLNKDVNVYISNDHRDFDTDGQHCKLTFTGLTLEQTKKLYELAKTF